MHRNQGRLLAPSWRGKKAGGLRGRYGEGGSLLIKVSRNGRGRPQTESREKCLGVVVMGGRTFLQGKTLDGMVANGVKAKAGHH